MAKLLICPHRHEWKATADDGARSSQEQVCPRCGARAVGELDARGEDEPSQETRFYPGERDTAIDLAELESLTGYELIAELGRGGMGVVYRAYDRRRDHVVALKTLQRADPASLHRFKQEFRALSNVTHPNLVTLYELVSDGDIWYFTMELIEGVNFLEFIWSGVEQEQMLPETVQLPKAVPDSRELSPEQISRLRDSMRQLSTGVAALHSAGILHRDIKPSNVRVDPDGRVVLLDFGLALEMQPTGDHDESAKQITGTIAYMSPEQAAGRSVSPSSDWYSVGVVLYESLTGRLPFTGKTVDVLTKKMKSDPRPPWELVSGVPRDLNDLCVDLLRGSAQDRPTASDVMIRLSGAGVSETVEQPRTAAVYATPLIGRARHLDLLKESFNAMRQGQTISVLVHGLSGQGKSALIQRFIEVTVRREEAVVLAGRCYERESVPYKALDALIDSLSGYLMQLSEREAAWLMPRDILALARVFPVLRRVQAIRDARGRSIEIPDQQELRRRAFSALRELLARIADQTPLVLFIDDLQWGDVDSAALLWDLLRPPDSPALLFLGCYRSDEVEISPFLRKLHDLQQKSGTGAQQRELEVGPLREAESVSLVLDLLGREDEQANEQAKTIARESGGTPFFVMELVKHAQAGGLAEDVSGVERLKLDEVLWSRVTRCSDTARQLLEVVSVAGQPIRLEHAYRAAEVHAQGPTVLVQMQTDHLIRTIGSDEETEVETYHDRVRQSVVAHLSPETLKDHHLRLATTLESSDEADPEALAVHFDGAEQIDKAGKYYAEAAAKAADALAFDRAAKLYRRAIDLQPTGAAEVQTLRKNLGDALTNAGRGLEAAQAYLSAIEGASGAERLDLRRRAAAQYVLSGHMDQGLDELRNVLRYVGMKLPTTPFRALVSLLWQRARLRMRGFKFNKRSEDQVPADELTRVDTCWSVGTALSVVDPIRGSEFQTRSVLLSLRSGEPYRIARSLAWEAAHVSADGGKTLRRTTELLETADAMAQQVTHPHAFGMVALANGLAGYLQGRFRVALDFCDRAEQTFRENCTGVAWELDTAHTFSLWSLTYLGELAELTRRRPKHLQEARERGDLYALTNFSTYIMSLDRLAADQPEEGREEMNEAMRQWTQRGFMVQHHNALLAETLIDLYLGKCDCAWRRITEVWPLYRRSLLLRVEQVHIDVLQSRGRCALAAATTAADPDALLRSAQQDAKRLERKKMPWSLALAQLILAGVAAAQGEVRGAAARFKTAAGQLDDVDMKLFAAAARRRRGELIGGDEGEALVAESVAWMESQGIQKPSRMCDMVVPAVSTPR